jgi:hypothetical protein
MIPLRVHELEQWTRVLSFLRLEIPPQPDEAQRTKAYDTQLKAYVIEHANGKARAACV